MKLDSAFLVQYGDRYELRDIDLKAGCFSTHGGPGRILAVGSREACEAAARLLGFHIDIITSDQQKLAVHIS